MTHTAKDSTVIRVHMPARHSIILRTGTDADCAVNSEIRSVRKLNCLFGAKPVYVGL